MVEDDGKLGMDGIKDMSENEKLLPEIKEFAKDVLETTQVASDFLCYLQETGKGKDIPEKGDVLGMRTFLQDFFDYMAKKINEAQDHAKIQTIKG